jgi:hypothetical protein
MKERIQFRSGGTRSQRPTSLANEPVLRLARGWFGRGEVHANYIQNPRLGTVVQPHVMEIQLAVVGVGGYRSNPSFAIDPQTGNASAPHFVRTRQANQIHDRHGFKGA